MFRNFAWTLVLIVVVSMAGVLGCASDPARKSTRNGSTYRSTPTDLPSHASCH